MRNVWLLTKREYLERVRTRAFLIFTLLTPAFMFCVTVLPGKLATMKSSAAHIVVVASEQALGDAIRQNLLKSLSAFTKAPEVEVTTDASDASREALISRVSHGKIEGFLWATKDAIDQRSVSYSSRSASDFMEKPALENALQQALIHQRFAQRGFSTEEVEALLRPVNIRSIPLSQGKSTKFDQQGVFAAGFFMLMLMYMTVLIYGMNVMRSVLEEKSSRILEVLLSTASAREIMAGKILGVGAVGLTQIGIWGVLSASYPATAGSLLAIHLSGADWAAFAVFFLLGYFLYSALCGAIGAALNSEQEAQQVNFIVAMPLILSVMIGIYVIRQPDDPVSVFFSLVPFCAPIIMLLRIMLHRPDFWQIGLSIALMLATIYFMVVLCSKIYRVGILMYGKRPTLPEIVKWLRYS